MTFRCTEIARRFVPSELHSRAYVVGGAIRDELMGNADKMHDVDVVLDHACAADHELLMAAGFQLVSGKSFPVFTKRDATIEVQVAFGRTEVATGNGHSDVAVQAFGVGIEEDSKRRDFTINAINCRLSDDEISDFCGGQRDIKAKVLRACGSAFVEDPERAFRAFRFAAQLDFAIDEQMLPLLLECERRFEALPVERVFNEMMRAMACKAPWRFFEEMIRSGVGKRFFGPVFEMANVPAGPKKFHGTDSVFQHSIDVLKGVCKLNGGPDARIAAMFHDIGKLLTPPSSWPHHYGHDGQAAAGFARLWLKSLKATNEVIDTVVAVVERHMLAGRVKQLRPATRLRVMQGLSISRFVDLMQVAAVDSQLSNEEVDMLFAAHVVSQLSATELGVVEKIQAMKDPKKIQECILQVRVKRLSALLKDAKES